MWDEGLSKCKDIQNKEKGTNDPWGTPRVTRIVWDLQLQMDMWLQQPDSYEVTNMAVLLRKYTFLTSKGISKASRRPPTISRPSVEMLGHG